MRGLVVGLCGSEAHRHHRAGGVLHGVGQRLLHHAIGDELRGRGRAGPGTALFERDGHATSAQVVEQGGEVAEPRAGSLRGGRLDPPGRALVGQHPQHLAHLPHRSAAARLHRRQGARCGRGVVRRQGQAGGARLDRDGAQPVPDEVVQVAGDPQPLLGGGTAADRLDAGPLAAHQHRRQGDEHGHGDEDHDGADPGAGQLGRDQQHAGRHGCCAGEGHRLAAVPTRGGEGPDQDPPGIRRDHALHHAEAGVAREYAPDDDARMRPAPHQGQPRTQGERDHEDPGQGFGGVLTLAGADREEVRDHHDRGQRPVAGSGGRLEGTRRGALAA